MAEIIDFEFYAQFGVILFTHHSLYTLNKKAVIEQKQALEQQELYVIA